MCSSNPTQILWGVSETVYTNWLRLAPIERPPLGAQLAPDLLLNCEWNANELQRTDNPNQRGRVWGTGDAVDAKEVSRNCSQVFEALQFASFQTEYEYENPIQTLIPPTEFIFPNEHKENAKAISWNRLGKYILFLMWHVFLSVLCDWAT